MQCFKSAGPEFRREVQPPTSLNGLDVPSRRAVFVPWKPSRRRGSEWETRLSVEEPMLSTGLHLTSESTGPAQKFLSTRAAAAYNTFNVQRHLISAQSHRVLRAAATSTWREVVAAA